MRGPLKNKNKQTKNRVKVKFAFGFCNCIVTHSFMAGLKKVTGNEVSNSGSPVVEKSERAGGAARKGAGQDLLRLQ